MSAQSYSRPLVQVYNPVVGDDSMMENPSNPGSSVHPAINGPAITRRRFTLTQRRPVEPSDQAHSTQLTRYPTISTMNYQKISPPDHGILRSRSQDRNAKMQTSPALKSKASDISTGELQHSAFMQRLDDIERTQAKIETLLSQISQSISNNKVNM